MLLHHGEYINGGEGVDPGGGSTNRIWRKVLQAHILVIEIFPRGVITRHLACVVWPWGGRLCTTNVLQPV